MKTRCVVTRALRSRSGLSAPLCCGLVVSFAVVLSIPIAWGEGPRESGVHDGVIDLCIEVSRDVEQALPLDVSVFGARGGNPVLVWHGRIEGVMTEVRMPSPGDEAYFVAYSRDFAPMPHRMPASGKRLRIDRKMLFKWREVDLSLFDPSPGMGHREGAAGALSVGYCSPRALAATKVPVFLLTDEFEVVAGKCSVRVADDFVMSMRLRMGDDLSLSLAAGSVGPGELRIARDDGNELEISCWSERTGARVDEDEVVVTAFSVNGEARRLDGARRGEQWQGSVPLQAERLLVEVPGFRPVFVYDSRLDREEAVQLDVWLRPFDGGAEARLLVFPLLDWRLPGEKFLDHVDVVPVKGALAPVQGGEVHRDSAREMYHRYQRGGLYLNRVAEGTYALSLTGGLRRPVEKQIVVSGGEDVQVTLRQEWWSGVLMELHGENGRLRPAISFEVSEGEFNSAEMTYCRSLDDLLSRLGSGPRYRDVPNGGVLIVPPGRRAISFRDGESGTRTVEVLCLPGVISRLDSRTID